MLGWVSYYLHCGIRVRDMNTSIITVVLKGLAHLVIRFLFVLNLTSINPKQLHVKPVNAAASRASSLRLSLIIMLAESVSFKRGELAVS